MTFWVLGLAYLMLDSHVFAQEVATDSIGTRYRLIEGGRFVQGTTGGERALERAFPLSTAGQFFGNAEAPAHVTWITKPYYIAETEVTVAQFRKFVEETGYVTSAEKPDTQMAGWLPTPEDKPLYQSYDFLRDNQFSWRSPGFDQQDDHPVVGVSYSDAKAFCAWLSETDGAQYRLPTEAEWEFACRAGTDTWFSFGDTARGVVHEFGNLGNVELERHRKHAAERQWLLDWDNDPSDGHVFTSPAGTYQPNAWGLKDMHGNVWEWCEDLWLDTVYKDYQRPKYNEPNGTAVDPVNTDRPQTPTNDFHTIRGGSWYNGDLVCRSANRSYWDRDDAACYLGFRLVREPPSGSEQVARQKYEREQEGIQIVEAAGGHLYSGRGIDIEVRFEGDSFDEASLRALAVLPDLRRLSINWRKRDAQLTQQTFDHVCGLTSLESLSINSTFTPDDIDLSVLSRLKILQILRFGRVASLNDHHLEAFADTTSLQEFECFGTAGGLTDEGISYLSGNRDLHTLHVHENLATGEFLRDFIGCPLKSLRTTGLYNPSGRMTDRFAVEISQFPSLQSLTIERQPGITNNTLEHIGRLTNLQDLSIEGCSGLSDSGFVMLSGFQRLRTINLLECGAGDAAASALAEIPRIEVIRIISEDLSDTGLTALSQAFSVRELQVRSNLLTDAGLHTLGRINRLEELVIASDQITGSGLSPLCNLPSLRDVSLMAPALTDEAFLYLADARSIRKLRLAHQGIQPPAALTNNGIKRMARANWLDELWLPRNDTGITEDAILALDEEMPDTRVIPYTVNWRAE